MVALAVEVVLMQQEQLTQAEAVAAETVVQIAQEDMVELELS